MTDTAQKKPPLSKKRARILRATLFISIALLLYSVLAVLWSILVAVIAGATFFIRVTAFQQIYDTASGYIPSMNSIVLSAIAGCILLVLYFILRWRFKKGAARAAKSPT